MESTNSKKRYYQYLLKQSIENQNKYLFNIIPKEYIHKAGMSQEYYEFCINNNDKYSIKYAIFTSKDYCILKIFRFACTYGNLDIIEYILDYRSDIIYFIGNEMLNISSRNGHLHIVKHLIKYGVEANCLDNNPLIYASQCGHLDIVKYLVEHGADVNAQDNRALEIAIENEYEDIIEYLESLT